MDAGDRGGDGVPSRLLELFKQVNMDCASVDIDPVREAIAPVLHWYQSDEHEDRSTVSIMEDMVSDLQRDREDALLVNLPRPEGRGFSGGPQAAFFSSFIGRSDVFVV